MTDCTSAALPDFFNCGCQCTRWESAGNDVVTANNNCVAENKENFVFNSEFCGCECGIDMTDCSVA